MGPRFLARFLAGAIAWSAIAPLSAQAEFYASNETGMAFEEVPEFRKRDFEYNLEIRRVPGGQLRTVYERDGSEFRRWEYDQDPEGRVTEIRFFESGALKERESYRADGRLGKFEEYGPKGIERGTAYE